MFNNFNQGISNNFGFNLNLLKFQNYKLIRLFNTLIIIITSERPKSNNFRSFFKWVNFKLRALEIEEMSCIYTLLYNLKFKSLMVK